MKKTILKSFALAMLVAFSASSYGSSKDNSPRTLFPDNAIEGSGKIYFVHDGDTVTMNLSDKDYKKFKSVSNSGFKKQNLNDKYRSVKMRIASINTEESVHRIKEKNTKKGKISSDYLKSWASKKNASYSCYDHGDYGRPICIVSIDGRDIGYDMIINGHSEYVTYFGKNPYYDKEYRAASK